MEVGNHPKEASEAQQEMVGFKCSTLSLVRASQLMLEIKKWAMWVQGDPLSFAFAAFG